YYWAKNGRRDNFIRGKGEYEVSDHLTLVGVGYIQERNYYGTATVPRSSAFSQIAAAYKYWKSIGGVGLRPDIYPQFAYKDANGNLVPYGTPGATPVGYKDLRGSGIYETGDPLDFTSTPTEFSTKQALLAPGSTATNPLAGIPGHTARYEKFGGPRLGGLGKALYTIGNNLITAGAWVEDDFQKTIRPQYNILGGSIVGPQAFDQVLFVNYDRHIDTKVANAFIQDDLSLLSDQLKVNFGSKLIWADRVATGWLTTADWVNLTRRRNEGKYHDYFLPQVGASYKLAPHVEVFANYAENFAVPPSDLLLGLNNPGIDPPIKGEKSRNYEAGVRYSGKSFGASLAIFTNDYSNRIAILSLTTQEQIDRNVLNTVGSNYYTSAGAITSKGVELGAEWKTPITGLKVVASASYLSSKFGDDLRTAYQSWMDGRNTSLTAADYAVLAPYQALFTVSSIKNANGDAQYTLAHIAGKYQLNAPKLYGNVDVTYTKGSAFGDWSATFGTEYKGSVYLNAFNTETLPSYVKNSLFLSWHGKRGTKLEPFSLSLTVSNLFDKVIYYSSASGSSPVTATLFGGTVIADQGRQGLLTVEAKF
ncbi:MAG TPA: TonB-dependent receptor, partial [Opitutaceae bacterium]|nr:TonB-dependent receptor [Opitutaceae bacterium]